MSPRIDREAFTRLHEQGVSSAQIAEQMHCSEVTVWRVRKELGLNPGHNPMTPERRARIQQMLDDGWSWVEIQRTEGAKWETMARHFPGTQWTREQAVELGAVSRWNKNLIHKANYAQPPRKSRAA